jgi:hypothetical protein
VRVVVDVVEDVELLGCAVLLVVEDVVVVVGGLVVVVPPVKMAVVSAAGVPIVCTCMPPSDQRSNVYGPLRRRRADRPHDADDTGELRGRRDRLSIERQLQARRAGGERHRRQARLDVHGGLTCQPEGIRGAEDDLVADAAASPARRSSS